MDKAKSSLGNLEQEGWTRRFTVCEPRLSESVEMYRDAGFEVCLEPLPGKDECDACSPEANNDSCQVCFEGVEEQHKIIFTRPKKNQNSGPEDELF